MSISRQDVVDNPETNTQYGTRSIVDDTGRLAAQSRSLKMLIEMRQGIPLDEANPFEWYSNSYSIPAPHHVTTIAAEARKTKDNGTTYKDWDVTTVIDPYFNVPLHRDGESWSSRAARYTLPTRLATDAAYALKNSLKRSNHGNPFSGCKLRESDIKRSVNSVLHDCMSELTELGANQYTWYTRPQGQVTDDLKVGSFRVDTGLGHVHTHRLVWTVKLNDGWAETPEGGVFQGDGWYDYAAAAKPSE